MRALSVAAAVVVGLSLGASGGSLAAQESPPDPVVVDPDRYSLEYENDAIRILRIRYGPGEASVMHYHPANCAIFLAAGSGHMELPDGKVESTSFRPGDVMCVDAEMYRPSNAGDAPFELVLVEMKGRESLEGGRWGGPVPTFRLSVDRQAQLRIRRL